VARHRLAFTVGVLGGALFVTSLASAAWLYAVRLAPTTGRQPMDAWAAARNAGLFLAFAVHHSLLARAAAKRWLTRHVPPALERSLYVWIASLLFLTVCFGWVPTTDVAWTLDGTTAWVGWSMQALGLVVTTLGARVLDPLSLAGIRQLRVPPGRHAGAETGPRGTHDPADARNAPSLSGPLDRISTRGPYGLVRHPIYLGWILLVWATPTMNSGRLLFAALTTLYLVIAIPLEERSLATSHPVDYSRYRQQVRWRVIPGVY
jgi:protein-S-isoprenylcysteine O-methyltransferase Ste14